MTENDELDYHERFEALRSEGTFVVPHCADCGKTFWHPRRHCPNCGSSHVDYTEPAWPARVYTYTVNHRPAKGDRDASTAMVGYVETADGLRLLATLELPATDNVIGSAVRPDARPADDGMHFVFVPAIGA
ncbi:OB-fold domain-containing protein [soil metagenome]